MTLHIPRDAHPVVGFAVIAFVLLVGLLAAVAITRSEATESPVPITATADPAAEIARLTAAYSASQAYIRSIDAEYRALQADFDALTDAICREGYTVERVDGVLVIE